MVQMQQFDDLKKDYEHYNSKNKEDSRFKHGGRNTDKGFQSAQQRERRDGKISALDDQENRSEMAQSLPSFTASDVRGLLWDFNNRLNKNDIYFRNQEKLMKNACLPEGERQKINNKMRFQTKHADLLARPKNVTEKYKGQDHSNPERRFKEVSIIDKRAQTLERSASKRRAGQVDIMNSENTKALKDLLKQKSGKIMVEDFAPAMPASIVLGHGSSLAQTGRAFQEGYSQNV